MATQEEITKIIENTDMVELVSPYVKLSKPGKNYKGYVHFITKILLLLSYRKKNIWHIVLVVEKVEIRYSF